MVLADLGDTLLCSSCYDRGVDNGGQMATRLEEPFAPKSFLCTGFKPWPAFSMVREPLCSGPAQRVCNTGQ